jgi:Holliday junction resolvase RusA-like endonuclease
MGGVEVRFVIDGYIVPYVRMTQRSKWTPRAQRYLASQQAVALQIKTQANRRGWDPVPGQTPVSVDLSVTVAGRLHCSDLDNTVKAVLDATQHAGILPDDRWVDAVSARRELREEYRAVLTIETLGG